ncbi:4-hydroxy-3-methylbut-2-enyl diphosphate reductase [Desulfovibrio sp. OttesenSCG-928-F07]|nr:4-hydroxy-3-methylbut-2-enyl diphosphate reductase [Desulfovibrio sp. OttesenSCG-928-F07]
MQVIKAKTAGFCMGVSLAIKRLDKALLDYNKNESSGLYTLGPIIHNPQVVKEYEEKGAICLNNPGDVPQGATVVIRAHGLPCDIQQQLQERGLKIIDATCPKVKAAQVLIQKAHSSGQGTMLLFGEAEHPEVKGLLSYANGDALVFGSMEELKELPLDKNKNYFLAAQTTQEKNIFEQVQTWLTSFLQHDFAVLSTICDATRNRQDDVIELSKNVKSMVVVGGMNSGNTRRLAEISQNMGVFTVHCENAASLPLEKLTQLQPVGLSAGASTPHEHINEVERVLIQN